MKWIDQIDDWRAFRMEVTAARYKDKIENERHRWNKSSAKILIYERKVKKLTDAASKIRDDLRKRSA